MIDAYPNEPIKLYAKLHDEKAAKLLKLQQLELVNDKGEVIKSLNANNDGSEWISGYTFPIASELGTYEVRWTFSFNGQPLIKQEYIKLHSDLKITTNAAVMKNNDNSYDNTLPPDLQYLTEAE